MANYIIIGLEWLMYCMSLCLSSQLFTIIKQIYLLIHDT